MLWRKEGEKAGRSSDDGGDVGASCEEAGPSCGFEWKTRARLFGLPLICIACGSDEQGKRRTAKGMIAIGQYAVGGIAVGQFAIGLIALGQFAFGIAAFGQLALGMLTGWGQLAIGVFAVGQVVVGVYARGQTGWAEFLWSPRRTDMEAVAMFETIRWLPHQDLATIVENLSFCVETGLDSLLSLFK